MDELAAVKEKEFRKIIREVFGDAIRQEQPWDSPYTIQLKFYISKDTAGYAYSKSLLMVLFTELAFHFHFLELSIKYQIVMGSKVADPHQYAEITMYIHAETENGIQIKPKDTMEILTILMRLINNLALTLKGTMAFETEPWTPIIYKDPNKPSFLVLPINMNLMGGHPGLGV